jgi:glycine oxidase
VALAQRLGDLGVPVQFGLRAVAKKLTGRCVINCTGLAARGVLTDLRGVKGEMLLVRLHDVSLSRPVRVLHPRIPLYIVPRTDGLFMVGATMIESDQPTRITARSMLELLSAAYALHPAFGEAEILEIGTGVRPAFPDNLPRIGWHGGALYVNGLYRHGFLLAPALARMAAQVVLEDGHFPEVMDEDPGERRLA